jgi:D-alanyl-D-alanine carboxypeptidase
MTTGTRRVLPGLAAAAALLTAACGSTPTAATDPPATTAPATTAPAYAAALEPQLATLAADMLTTGAAVVVRSPQGDWTWTYGTRTYKGDDPVGLGDHVRVGSNTKPMTATVILQLVDEGKVGLDDPIAKYRPDVPDGAAITIRDLLAMRSGLYNYSTAPELNREQDADPARVYTPDELLALAYTRPPTFAPNQGWEYSNTNYVLLGLVIEQVTGKSAGENFQERIFDRLGMSGASFPAATDASIPDPHPRGYTYGTNVATMDTLVLPQDVQDEARAGTLAPIDTTDASVSWGWTAGSAIATADDLVRFAQALGGGGLLAPATQQERLAGVAPIHPDDPSSAQYGLGLGRFGPLYGHTGEIPGFNSFMGYDPATRTTIVVWATDAPAVDGRAPATELAKLIIGSVFGP